jgi:hypothetical protein
MRKALSDGGNKRTKLNHSCPVEVTVPACAAAAAAAARRDLPRAPEVCFQQCRSGSEEASFTRLSQAFVTKDSMLVGPYARSLFSSNNPNRKP